MKKKKTYKKGTVFRRISRVCGGMKKEEGPKEKKSVVIDKPEEQEEELEEQGEELVNLEDDDLFGDLDEESEVED